MFKNKKILFFIVLILALGTFLRFFKIQDNLIFNGERIRQFPIVKIFDKNYRQWAQRFIIDYETEMERPDDEGIRDLPIFYLSGTDVKELEDLPF